MNAEAQPRCQQVVIGIGSNLADASAMVEGAVEWLKTILGHCRCSGIYRTQALHQGEPDYSNAVAIGEYTGTPGELTAILKDYERSQGRRPGHVAIDLDLVCYGDEVLRARDFAMEYFQVGYRRIADAGRP